jgi:hypothetical protein
MINVLNTHCTSKPIQEFMLITKLYVKLMFHVKLINIVNITGQINLCNCNVKVSAQMEIKT